MACCCRTAALRTFTRGYTQLHIADSASGAISPSIWRQSRTVTVPRVRYRSLHYTSAWRNEAATAEPRAMSESLKQHARNPLPEQHQQNSGTIDNAAPSGSESVAELTPEAIDALASEITPSRNLPDIDPHQSEAVANPSKKSRHASLEPREPAARLPRKVRRLLQFGPGDTPPQTDMTEEERKKSRRDSTNLKDKRKDTYAAARKNTRGPADELKPEKEPWMVQKDALEKKFGDEGWRPQKRLSPDALQGIRALHQQFPDVYTTPVLAERFEMSPEAIRRILKSKWTPSNEEEEQRQQRWFKRGKQIWEQKAQQGAKPPKKWRDEGIKTNWNAKRQFVKRRSEQRRRDLEENDSPPSQFNDRARPYRFRIGNNTVGHESQPLRRHGGPRRLGHAGGSGKRQD